jgi:uncharacterized protein (UPF0548 family)
MDSKLASKRNEADDNNPTSSTTLPSPQRRRRLALDDLPQSPREGAALCFVFRVLLATLCFLLTPFRWLVTVALSYRHVHVLSVLQDDQHRTIGVYGSLPAAQVALTEILALPEYEGLTVRIAILEFGQGEMGAVVDAHHSVGGEMLVVVQKMCVRRAA